MFKPIKFLIFIAIIALMPSVTKATCPLNLNNLSIDNQNNKDVPDIIRLQSIMYINNLYDGPITGYYGTKTENAINWFKQSYGLNPNGIVDQDTLSLLCSNYALCPFQTNLEKNDETPVREIKALQSFLKLLPNIYPEKLVTGFYGTKTEKAVKRLQKQLNISQTGKIDNTTKQEFCNFFNTFVSNDISSASSATTSIFQTLCLPFPKQAKTGESILFISQILGGSSPYKYIWNNKTNNSDKTFKTAFTKAGTYTVNLKIVDNTGNISSTNCKVNITGNTITKDNTLDIDWDGFVLDSDSKEQVIDTSTYDKYLYSKKNWSEGWTCTKNVFASQYSCSYIKKTLDIYDKITYVQGTSNTYSLPNGTMIYDTQNECNGFCNTKTGDSNTLAYTGTPVSISPSTSISNRMTQETYITSKGATQNDINKLIKNPLNLDCEILPREIVKGDPVKINIINMPPWVRNMIDNPDNEWLTLRGYWSGSILNQYLDTFVGEHESYDLIDKNNKILTNSGSVPSCGDSYTYVSKVIPKVYCGDGKCDQKENDSKSLMYCRMDCLNNQNITNNSDISIRSNTTIKNILFSNLIRDGIHPYTATTLFPIEQIRLLMPRFFNSGVFSLISDVWIRYARGQFDLYDKVTNERAPHLNNTVDMKRNFYSYNPNLQNGVLGRSRHLYWSFNKAGNYQFDYNLYYYNSKENKEYLIGKTNGCSVNVVDKPTEGKYMRMFLTYEKPQAGKIDCPKNFYWINPQNENLIYITPEIAKFKNVVTKYSSWPFRDLDGNFMSFDWNYLYTKKVSEGGDIWNYGLNDTSYPSRKPGTAILSVPLIAERKYDNKMNKKITRQNEIDINVINRPIERNEYLNLGSRYYQPFSCKDDGSIYYDRNNQTTHLCLGMDSAGSILFGYQNNEDIIYSEGWRSQNLNSNIYSGHGLTSSFRSKKSRTLCIEEPLIEETPPISKRKKEYYSDLTLSNFQLGTIKNSKRSVTIDIENLGDQTVSLDEIVKKGTGINNIIICNRLDDGSGENIGSFNYSFVGQGLNSKSKMTLKSEFDCRPKEKLSGEGYTMPAISGNIEIACIVDPNDLEEEANENNNILTKIYFNCN